jgi:hypothetical protein
VLPTSSVGYGSHMVVGLATGLLFLGGGAATLSTSDEAVAALLISLFPLWPASPSDNRCHLQARLAGARVPAGRHGTAGFFGYPATATSVARNMHARTHARTHSNAKRVARALFCAAGLPPPLRAGR